MNQDITFAYFNELLNILTSPLGIVGVLFAIIFTISLVAFQNARWAGLGLLMYFSIHAPPNNEWYNLTLALPLNYIAQYARYITVFLLFALLGTSFLNAPRPQWRAAFSITALILFSYQLFFCLRLMASPHRFRGFSGALLFPVVFALFCIALPRWASKTENLRKPIWSIAVCGIAITLETCYQLLANRHAAVPAGRLFGTTQNPQMMAMIMSFSIQAVLYLFILTNKNVIMKGLGYALIGLMTIFMLWTGSRTGVLMTIGGVIFLLRSKNIQIVLILLPIALILFVVLKYSVTLSEDTSRISSLHDTRSDIWRILIQDFWSNPMMGFIPSNDIDIGENSYLSAFGRTGILGGILMIGFALALIGSALRLMSFRKGQSKEMVLYIDYIIAGFASLFLCSMTEGIFLGMLSYPLFVTFIYISLGAVIIGLGRANGHASAGNSS